MTKFRPFLVSGVFLLTLAVSDALFPAQLDDLFDASVPVAGKESGNREGGLRDALLAVLVKLTGRRDIAEDPAAANLLGRGRSFLQRYTYEERENPPDPEDIFAQPVKEVLLHAWFDAVALQRAVRVAGLPLWGRERPTTLVWLAFETDGNRVLFSSHTAGNLDLLTKDDVFENPVTIIQQSIEEATSRRGIPWQFPFLDDEEKAVIGFTDVWGGFSERILAASERYATYGILAGNIFYAGEDRWSARWVLYTEHSETQWQVLAEYLTAAIDAGIDGTADLYG